MAEYGIYAGIVFVVYFVVLFILISLDGEDDVFGMSLVGGIMFTLVTLAVTALASYGSEWIQDNHFEQEPTEIIERINLEE